MCFGQEAENGWWAGMMRHWHSEEQRVAAMDRDGLEFALQNRYGPVRDIRKMADEDIRRQLLSVQEQSNG